MACGANERHGPPASVSCQMQKHIHSLSPRLLSAGGLSSAGWTDAAGSQRSTGTTGEKLIKRRQRRLLLSRLPRPEACKEPGRLGCELTSPGAEPLPPRFRPISPKPGNRLSSPAAAGAIPPQFCESRSPRPQARDPAPFSEGEGPGGPGTPPHAAVGGPGRVGGCSQSD